VIACCAAQSAERRRTPAERELAARMRPLARYQAQQAQHEALVEGLALEARLRARILVRSCWAAAGQLPGGPAVPQAAGELWLCGSPLGSYACVA
jgi:hypothetical protein